MARSLTGSFAWSIGIPGGAGGLRQLPGVTLRKDVGYVVGDLDRLGDLLGAVERVGEHLHVLDDLGSDEANLLVAVVDRDRGRLAIDPGLVLDPRDPGIRVRIAPLVGGAQGLEQVERI